jgi:hypothetical protein
MSPTTLDAVLRELEDEVTTRHPPTARDRNSARAMLADPTIIVDPSLYEPTERHDSARAQHTPA